MITNFNYTLRNTYLPVPSRGAVPAHYLETLQSKFVLCPSGLSMDTYRIWESLVLGAIPVVESNRGLDRTYNHLPVLVLKNFSYLTPQLLHSAYDCFMSHVEHFKFGILTVRYWKRLLDTVARTGSLEFLRRNHPFRNPYCSYI